MIYMTRSYASNMSNMVNGCTVALEIFRNNNKEKQFVLNSVLKLRFTACLILFTYILRYSQLEVGVS